MHSGTRVGWSGSAQAGGHIWVVIWYRNVLLLSRQIGIECKERNENEDYIALQFASKAFSNFQFMSCDVVNTYLAFDAIRLLFCLNVWGNSRCVQPDDGPVNLDIIETHLELITNHDLHVFLPLC